MRAALAAAMLCLCVAAAHAHPRAAHHRPAIVAGDPRPAAWCGWEMRQVMGVADRAYNRAAQWAQYGHRALFLAPGVIVVWRHHVGRLVGRDAAGRWLVFSGNDGHAVRTRALSLAGAIAFRAP